MKLSTSTLLAIAAATVVNGQAVPVANAVTYTPEQILDKIIGELQGFKSFLDDALPQKRDQIDDLTASLKEIAAKFDAAVQKRDLSEEGIEITKRDLGTAIGSFISALLNSGIISDAWNTISNDANLKSQLSSLVLSAFNGLVAALPNLLSALWNSGLIQNIVKTIFSNQAILSAIGDLVKEVFNIIVGLFSSKTSKRELDEMVNSFNSLVARDGIDFGSIISNVINWAVNWAKSNPDTIKSIFNLVINAVGPLITQGITWLFSGSNLSNIIDTIVKAIGLTLSSPEASAAVSKLQDLASATAEKSEASATGSATATATTSATAKASGLGSVNGDLFESLLGAASGLASGAASVASAAETPVATPTPAATTPTEAATTSAAASIKVSAAADAAAAEVTTAAAATAVAAISGAGANDEGVYASLAAAYGGKRKRMMY